MRAMTNGHDSGAHWDVRDLATASDVADLGDDVSVVVTDLDGTLWDSTTVVHDRTLLAVRALQERGLPVLVATGRSRRSALHLLERNELSLPVVALDGAVCQDVDGSVFHRVVFSRDDAAGVLQAMRAQELHPVVHIDAPPADSAADPDAALMAAQEAFYRGTLLRQPLDQLLEHEPAHQFVAYGPPSALDEAVRAASPHGNCTINRNALFGGTALTVDPFGATKWEGVQQFCERYDLDPDRVLAVGNGENDVDLLEHAHVACVVRDGCDEALAVATHVIEPPTVGGWAAVLDLLRGADGSVR